MSEYNHLVGVDRNSNLPPSILDKIKASNQITSLVNETVETNLNRVDSKITAEIASVKNELGEVIENSSVSRQKIIEALGFSLVFQDVAPSKDTEFGHPVYWVDTNVIREPDDWHPKAPVFSAESYTIPDDIGAEYLVDGVVKNAGEHQVTDKPTTITITARPKSGYIFSGQSEWSRRYEAYISSFDKQALDMNVDVYKRFNTIDTTSFGTLNPKIITNGTLADDIGTGYKSMTVTGNTLLQHLPGSDRGYIFYSIAYKEPNSELRFGIWEGVEKLGVRVNNPYKTNRQDVLVGFNGSKKVERSEPNGRSNIISGLYRDGVFKLYLNSEVIHEESSNYTIPSTAGWSVFNRNVNIAAFMYDISGSVTHNDVLKLHSEFKRR